MGTITRRSFHIVSDKINYIDMRQSMIMKIFRKTSLNISCSGYGNEKTNAGAAPILNRKQSNRALDILDFGKRIGKRTIASQRAAVITFAGIPLSLCLGIPVARKNTHLLYPVHLSVCAFLCHYGGNSFNMDADYKNSRPVFNRRLD